MDRDSMPGGCFAIIAFVGLFFGVMIYSGAQDGQLGDAAQRATGGGAPVSGSLANVPVREPGSTSGYSREEFGDGWASTRDGCDTRDLILRRDATDQPGESTGGLRDGCYPVSPRILDPYRGSKQDGEPPTAPWVSGRRHIDIDHRVPLSWAWKQGAKAWTVERREAFANDPSNLRATASAANRSKGDAGPAEWSPEINRCGYARGWVATLTKYGLTVGRADRAALASMLREC